MKSVLVAAGMAAAVSAATCPAHLTSKEIGDRLGPQLSENATILLPNSNDWDQVIARASYPRINPAYKAVVEVATEEDVEKTVKFANKCGLPFLATSGAHGWPSSLNGASGGLQVRLRKMNHATLSADGKSTRAGGGILQWELVEKLYKNKKAAVTGLCECVSALGPLLGGGHSMLQGKHGFAADNLISARVVTADGVAVTASEDENPDLFWAIRGAGHNFGIVTSFEAKTYPASKTWTMVAFTFTQEKLENYFETWNKVEAEHEDPGLLVLNGLFVRNTAIDAENPVINLQIFWEGKNEYSHEFVSAFMNLGPASNSTTKGIEYGDLYDVGGVGTTSSDCREDQNILGFPSSFPQWDPASMRKGFEIFSELTAEELFSTSAWLLESYGRGGVQAVPISANAVAPEERENHLLTSPILWWVGDDAVNQKKAEECGAKMRTAIRSGSNVDHAYVNYAMGSEGLREMYGHSDDRITKLKALKKKWDPENRFDLYNPI